MRFFRAIVIIGVIFFLSYSPASALDDGFGPAKKIEGKNFIIFYAPQVDLSGLAQQLNISAADRLMVGKPANGNSPVPDEIIDMLDTLFMRVSDILDIHLYTFQCNIKVCRDRAQLKDIYGSLFKSDISVGSFYVYDLNTIYVSPDSFKREIIGHEIAHAILSHYFVVQPSVKVAEVLAGYVEFQLRKTVQH